MKSSLLKLLLNLNYVNVDRAEAREHWNVMAKYGAMNDDVYIYNRHLIVPFKAVAGILSHKQTRGFTIHRLKERALRRRLNPEEKRNEI